MQIHFAKEEEAKKVIPESLKDGDNNAYLGKFDKKEKVQRKWKEVGK